MCRGGENEKQAGFAEPHSSLTMVGLGLGLGWGWVGLELGLGLGCCWVGVWLGLGWGKLLVPPYKFVQKYEEQNPIPGRVGGVSSQTI